MSSWLETKTILITGGTSGLGKELAQRFLSDGNRVITISRNGKEIHDFKKQLIIYKCDLSDLSEVAEFANTLAETKQKIDLLINNAGVLSPPDFLMTKDNYEFSYQVNFLSHYFLTLLLIEKKVLNPSLVVNVSSPIYKSGDLNLDRILNQNNYGLFRAYASTKLFMALFSVKLSMDSVNSFSYNPGTFNSSIYRMQRRWFQVIYKIAAPFMSSASSAADGMYEIIKSQSWQNGKMMKKNGDSMELIFMEESRILRFWEKVDTQLEKWLRNM